MNINKNREKLLKSHRDKIQQTQQEYISIKENIVEKKHIITEVISSKSITK